MRVLTRILFSLAIPTVAAVYEDGNELERVPLPLGEGGAMGAAEGRDELKRRVRVASLANPETLTLPSPSGRGWFLRNPRFIHSFYDRRRCLVFGILGGHRPPLQ